MRDVRESVCLCECVFAYKMHLKIKEVIKILRTHKVTNLLDVPRLDKHNSNKSTFDFEFKVKAFILCIITVYFLRN